MRLVLRASIQKKADWDTLLSLPVVSRIMESRLAKLLKSLAVEPYTKKVPMDHVVGTQSRVEESKVKSLEKKDRYYKLPEVVKYKGTYYIWDGHHRIEALYRKGVEVFSATVLDLDLALAEL